MSAHDESAALATYLAAFAQDAGYLDFARSGPPSRLAAHASAAGWERAITSADIDEPAANLRARCAVARVIGFGVDDIALVPNTSLGLFQTAFALDGAHVLLSRGEFPANLYPWWRAEELGILRLHTLAGSDLDPVTPDRVAASLRPETTAVAVSAVDFRTGWRADLVGIRDVIGDRLLIVDGIQAVGAIDAPWHVVDVLVAGGQKWLRAGWGTGFVAVSPRALARMTPRLSGWTGVERPTDYDGAQHRLAADAGHLSLTNGSPISADVFATALDLVDAVGIARIEDRIARSAAALDERLRDRGVEVVSPLHAVDRAGIVVARWDDGAAARWEALRARGVRATLHGEDRIRFSVHATTTDDDLDAAIAALAA